MGKGKDSKENKKIENTFHSFEDAFHKSMNDSNNNKKFDITEEEKNNILKAMEKPEFRTLLTDYLNDISNPKYRAEQEEYLLQLENQNKIPKDKIIIVPEPYFVVKTKFNDLNKPNSTNSVINDNNTNKNHVNKVFINICTSDKIDKPNNEKVISKHSINPLKTNGSMWKLPYSLGPKRFEKDIKEKNDVITYDICFHTDIRVLCSSNIRFKKIIIQTAIDGVAKVLDQKSQENYRILKGVKYKSGRTVSMLITKKKETKNNNINNDKNIEKKNKSIKNESIKRNVLKYKIIESGKFEMMNYMKNYHQLIKDNNRPKNIIVKIDLPNIKSIHGIELDVSNQIIKLNAPEYDELNIKLPYSIDEKKGDAKFDKNTSQLVITLPVQLEENLKVDS